MKDCMQVLLERPGLGIFEQLDTRYEIFSDRGAGNTECKHESDAGSGGSI